MREPWSSRATVDSCLGPSRLFSLDWPRQLSTVAAGPRLTCFAQLPRSIYPGLTLAVLYIDVPQYMATHLLTYTNMHLLTYLLCILLNCAIWAYMRNWKFWSLAVAVTLVHYISCILSVWLGLDGLDLGLVQFNLSILYTLPMHTSGLHLQFFPSMLCFLHAHAWHEYTVALPSLLFFIVVVDHGKRMNHPF